jgi:hypothetical protein
VIYTIFEIVVIALIGAWSAWFAARKFFPRACRKLQARLATALARSPHARARALAARVMPREVESGAGCDSGGGCSTCGNCASTATPAGDVHPLVFHPRAKR